MTGKINNQQQTRRQQQQYPQDLIDLLKKIAPSWYCRLFLKDKITEEDRMYINDFHLCLAGEAHGGSNYRLCKKGKRECDACDRLGMHLFEKVYYATNAVPVTLNEARSTALEFAKHFQEAHL